MEKFHIPKTLYSSWGKMLESEWKAVHGYVFQKFSL